MIARVPMIIIELWCLSTAACLVFLTKTSSVSLLLIVSSIGAHALSSIFLFCRYNFTELKNEALIPIQICTVAKCRSTLNTV